MAEPTYTRNCEIKPGIKMPDSMQRIALCAEYNGATFHGFQAQTSTVDTVQAKLQSALSSIADEDITVVCAGRTDAGVHATGQIVHFDTLATRPNKAWTLGANARLPQEISIRWAQPVAEEFHARFSALSRTYRYLIYNSDTRPALLSDQVTWIKRPLDTKAMMDGLQCLLGEQDFTSFRASQCQARSPIRHIHHMRMARQRDLIVLEVQANEFLHHMVRNIVGVLLSVGAGDKPVNWVEHVLAAKDRTQAGTTAPSAGLYLVNVEYDPLFGLPKPTFGPHFIPAHLPWL